MKSKIALVLIACMSVSAAQVAQAQSTTGTGTGTANAGATGGALTYAPVSGDVNNNYSASSAIAPGLTAGLKTCMGSSSVGGSGKIISISLGSTWHDEDCQAGEFGQQLWNQGFKQASIGVLCSRDVIRYAIAVTGGIPYLRSDGAIVHRACPMKQADWEKAGEPLLEPVTGQPYTEAELNPPTKVVPVAVDPHAPPTQAAVDAAKAELVEQHAASIKAQTVAVAQQ